MRLLCSLRLVQYSEIPFQYWEMNFRSCYFYMFWCPPYFAIFLRSNKIKKIQTLKVKFIKVVQYVLVIAWVWGQFGINSPIGSFSRLSKSPERNRPVRTIFCPCHNPVVTWRQLMNPPVKAFHRDVLASETTHGLLQPFGRLHRAKSSQFIPEKPSTLLLFITNLDFPSRGESPDSCKPCHQND